ncbi:hypothetical protein BFP72_01770 [Reichenbachiella sp. 5M10]|uniref:hypothetical protein n=1 Tax=Reichenbachiella sp. 5M10 TaxID=1889772 RepID=UPI000C14B0A7|nr:hypothetical protein [Reichenbachiella sp. 5M10]PIB34247.1 hypothetical protein BFP72_01770 [Reichenbachiella sp. 5M10]
MHTTLRYFLYGLSFVILTVFTQIGGIALLVGVFACKHIKFRFNRLVLPLAAYAIFTFVITPIVAPLCGRERVKNSDKIKPTSFATILLNRNYVKPALNTLLFNTAEQLPSDFELKYLDANFPFINKFPLLPHLSHSDGKKIDISLMYQSSDGQQTNRKPSRTGYGVFVEPTASEYNQTLECKRMGYYQYDFPKYLTLGTVNSDIRFSTQYTKTLIEALLKSSQLQKLFVEKHLTSRMDLSDSRIRFQGCRAVRHDDHIHIQIK